MKKIVLIEDDKDIRETTSEILELSGYSVYTAENGLQGLKLVDTEKPDLIICDVMMPDLNGFGVLQILSEKPESFAIPFIFLTAKNEKSDIRHGMKLGAEDYLTKPFEESELLEVVDIQLRKYVNISALLSSVNQDTFQNEEKGEEALKILLKGRREITYAKKEIIFRDGDISNYLYFVTNGKVKSFKTDTYGKNFTNDIRVTGDFIGYTSILQKTCFEETTVAMELSHLVLIPAEDFKNLINKNKNVANIFIKLLSTDKKDREQRLLQLAYAPVRVRLAHTLLNLQKKENKLDGLTDHLNISREDFANIIGTAKESLIRSLTELKNEGLINTNGQEIMILNEIGLKKIAAEL